jgi:hypothetical protein
MSPTTTNPVATPMRTWSGSWMRSSPDRFDKRQPRPQRALRIILMRLRITEVSQHPVAHVLRHEPVEPGDRLRDALVIGADYGTQIFGSSLVESAVEPTRSVNMTVSWRRSASSRRVGSADQKSRYGSRGVAEIADRTQHFQPTPERNAKIFEVLVGQVGENGNINVVLDEPLRVLGHAEPFEPVRNLLHRGHQRSRQG